MVVVPKANGKVRICVDLTRLNDSVRHPLPAIDQTLAQQAGAKIFTKQDTPILRVDPTHDIYHPLRSFLLPQIALRDNISA